MIIYAFYNELSKKSPIFLEETITMEKSLKRAEDIERSSNTNYETTVDDAGFTILYRGEKDTFFVICRRN